MIGAWRVSGRAWSVQGTRRGFSWFFSLLLTRIVIAFLSCPFLSRSNRDSTPLAYPSLLSWAFTESGSVPFSSRLLPWCSSQPHSFPRNYSLTRLPPLSASHARVRTREPPQLAGICRAKKDEEAQLKAGGRSRERRERWRPASIFPWVLRILFEYS